MAYSKHRAQRARKFEEEVKDQTTDTTTEEGGEESTPDSHEQFVNILTEMGLSADQAEAVHQMAMDLVNAGGAQEGDAQETQMARARRRAAMSRRARGARSPRREFSRGVARGESRGARPMGRRFSESPRGRRPLSARSRQMGASNMEAQLRRQRREIVELKRQLREFGAQPAARPARARENFNTQPKAMSTGGNVLDRVKSFINK